MAKKKLSPIPFEAQQAQSEWLLDRFDRGLNSYENHYTHHDFVDTEENAILRALNRARELPIVPPQSFQFAVNDTERWLQALRTGDINPTDPVSYTVLTVTVNYNASWNTFGFTTYYKNQKITVGLSAEYLARHGDYQNIVHRKMLEQIRLIDNV